MGEVGDFGTQTGLLILLTLGSGTQSLGIRDKCAHELGKSRLGELQVGPFHLVTEKTGGW